MGRREKATTQRVRRTWPQRLVLLLSTGTFVACVVSAAGIWYGNHQLGRIKRVDIASAPLTPLDTIPKTSVAAISTPTTEAEPKGDIHALNFLVVGSDSRDCIDRNSPYAGAFVHGGDTGYNSDTIMLIRVDPDSNTAALVSFPRDTWVKLAGSNASGKINSVYSAGNPTRLVQTLEQNFKLHVDHYIDIDFCAFKDLVDAVGGVSVPFLNKAFDEFTGLDVESGCHKFGGEEALAYVRSRSYQYYDTEKRRWIPDLQSDYGRIARQQDFIRRTLQRAIDQGVRNPSVANKLVNAALARVKVDLNLRVNDLLLLASRLRSFDPAKLKTYRFDGPFADRAGQSVILPSLDYPPNAAVLKLFRGQARLSDAPNVDNLTTTTSSTPSLASTSPTGGSTGSAGSTTSTTAVVDVKDNSLGFVPPNDPSCR